MPRRGNNIYHRTDGRWEGRCYCKGTHKYKSVYGKTYTEAKKKLDRLRNKVLVPSAKCNLLFADVMKMWLESRRTRIKESSYASYRNKLEKHILTYFGALKYSRLDLSRIDSFILDKLTEGLSEKYVSDMVIMLKSAAKWAEINYNYTNQIRNAESPKPQTKEVAVFSQGEQKQLLTVIQQTKDLTACGVFLTMFTGLRIGELCALQWKDIDFSGKVLHIRKTVQRMPVFGAGRKTEVKITAPKSDASARDIPLPDFLLKNLSVHKGNPDDYVVSGSKKIVEPRTFTNRYKALLQKANIPSRKFHCLRHSFATNALQQSFDVKTLSEILGHTDANITMRVYIHSSMERKYACMNRLQALI